MATYRDFLFGSHIGTLENAIAEVLAQFEEQRQNVDKSIYLSTAGMTELVDRFSVLLNSQVDGRWDVEVYREHLQEIIQAFMFYDSTRRGVSQVVAATTQIPPFLRPIQLLERWLCGFQYLPNRNFTEFDGFVCASIDGPYEITEENNTLVLKINGVSKTFHLPTGTAVTATQIVDFLNNPETAMTGALAVVFGQRFCIRSTSTLTTGAVQVEVHSTADTLFGFDNFQHPNAPAPAPATGVLPFGWRLVEPIAAHVSTPKSLDTAIFGTGAATIKSAHDGPYIGIVSPVLLTNGGFEDDFDQWDQTDGTDFFITSTNMHSGVKSLGLVTRTTTNAFGAEVPVTNILRTKKKFIPHGFEITNETGIDQGPPIDEATLDTLANWAGAVGVFRGLSIPTFVSLIGTGGSLAGNPFVTVPSAGVASGNTIIVTVSALKTSGGATLSSVTDTAGNIYTIHATATRLIGTDTLQSWIVSTINCVALVSGNTITATFSVGTGVGRAIIAGEYSNITSFFESATGTGNSNTISIALNAVPLPFIIVASHAFRDPASTITPGGAPVFIEVAEKLQNSVRNQQQFRVSIPPAESRNLVPVTCSIRLSAFYRASTDGAIFTSIVPPTTYGWFTGNAIDGYVDNQTTEDPVENLIPTVFLEDTTQNFILLGAKPGMAVHIEESVIGPGTGTLTSSGTTVTGTGTFFTTELQIGTVITASAQTRTIVSILNDTSLVTDTAFAPPLSGASFEFLNLARPTISFDGIIQGVQIHRLIIDRWRYGNQHQDTSTSPISGPGTSIVAYAEPPATLTDPDKNFTVLGVQVGDKIRVDRSVIQHGIVVEHRQTIRTITAVAGSVLTTDTWDHDVPIANTPYFVYRRPATTSTYTIWQTLNETPGFSDNSEHVSALIEFRLLFFDATGEIVSVQTTGPLRPAPSQILYSFVENIFETPSDGHTVQLEVVVTTDDQGFGAFVTIDDISWGCVEPRIITELDYADGNIMRKIIFTDQSTLASGNIYYAGPPLAAPSVAIGAVGVIVPSTYRWLITALTNTVESQPGVLSTPLTLTVASQVNLTNIPLGPTGTTSRNIYREVSPGIPTFVVGGAGSIEAGLHSWAVSFIINGVETPIGGFSAQASLGVNSMVTVTAAFGPAGTTARNIYRTKVGDTQPYFFVGQIADNVTPTFLDNVSDVSLTIQSSGIPIFKLVGNVANPTTIFTDNVATTALGVTVPIGFPTDGSTVTIGDKRFEFSNGTQIGTGTIETQQGTGLISSSGTGVTGVGTSFNTEFVVGNTITANGQNRIVTVIGGALSLTINTPFFPNLPVGTPYYIGNSILGTGTLFTTELSVGDTLIVNGQNQVIASIVSPVLLTVINAFLPPIFVGSVFSFIAPVTIGNIAVPLRSTVDLTWDEFVSIVNTASSQASLRVTTSGNITVTSDISGIAGIDVIFTASVDPTYVLSPTTGFLEGGTGPFARGYILYSKATIPTNGETITVGASTYEFDNDGVVTLPNVTIPLQSGLLETWTTFTSVVNISVDITAVQNHGFSATHGRIDFFANTAGTVGNTYPFTEAVAGVTTIRKSGGLLSGGVNQAFTTPDVIDATDIATYINTYIAANFAPATVTATVEDDPDAGFPNGRLVLSTIATNGITSLVIGNGSANDALGFTPASGIQHKPATVQPVWKLKAGATLLRVAARAFRVANLFNTVDWHGRYWVRSDTTNGRAQAILIFVTQPSGLPIRTPKINDSSVYAITGTGTVTVGPTTPVVTGVGTTFATQIQLGDTIIVANQRHTVVSINNNLELAANDIWENAAVAVPFFIERNAPNNGPVQVTVTGTGAISAISSTTTLGTGTVSSGAANGGYSLFPNAVDLNGSGTLFTVEVQTGDLIEANGQTRTVLNVTNNTLLTVDSDWLPVLAPLTPFNILRNAITGLGTIFLTEILHSGGFPVSPEEIIVAIPNPAGTPYIRRILYISSQIQMKVDFPALPAFVGPCSFIFKKKNIAIGTVTSVGTTITSAGNYFTQYIQIGDAILVQNLSASTEQYQVRFVTAIGSDISLTVDTAFTPNIAIASPFTYQHGRAMNPAAAGYTPVIDIIARDDGRFDDAEMHAVFTGLSSGVDTISISSPFLINEISQSLHLSSNTIPRNKQREHRLYRMAVACPDEMSDVERGLLGLHRPVESEVLILHGGQLAELEFNNIFPHSDNVFREGIRASGTVFYRGNPTDGEKIRIGDITFEFDNNSSVVYGNISIAIGATDTATYTLLTDTINLLSPIVTAEINTTKKTITVTAITPGDAGNDIIFAESTVLAELQPLFGVLSGGSASEIYERNVDYFINYKEGQVSRLSPTTIPNPSPSDLRISYSYFPSDIALNENYVQNVKQVGAKIEPDITCLSFFNGRSFDFSDSSATRVNFDIVDRLPTRFSYLRPTARGRYTQVAEFVDTITPPFFEANLDYNARTGDVILDDATLTTNIEATLLRRRDDDITVVPEDKWDFVTVNRIRINTAEFLNPPVTGPFGSADTFEFQYFPRFFFETAPIHIVDTTSGYRLLPYSYKLAVLNEEKKDVDVILFPNELRIATLKRPAITDQLLSSLVKEVGGTTTTLTENQWRFVDTTHLEIFASAFEEGAVWDFRYKTAEQAITSPVGEVFRVATKPPVDPLFPDIPPSFSTSDFTVFEPGENRLLSEWTKFRVDVSGDFDEEDYRFRAFSGIVDDVGVAVGGFGISPFGRFPFGDGDICFAEVDIHLAGSLGLAGSLSVKVFITLAGVLSLSGILTTTVFLPLSGSLGLSGTGEPALLVPLSGSLALSGALAAVLQETESALISNMGDSAFATATPFSSW